MKTMTSKKQQEKEKKKRKRYQLLLRKDKEMIYISYKNSFKWRHKGVFP